MEEHRTKWRAKREITDPKGTTVKRHGPPDQGVWLASEIGSFKIGKVS